MSQLGSALGHVAADLDALGASWALVGGLAVGARAEPRTTRDIDIAVLVADDAEAERLVFALRQRGYEVLAAVEQRKLKRLATVRLRPPSARSQGPVVDLLFCSSGVEAETVDAAEELEALPSVIVRVARIPHLVAMKILARDDRRRPQDLDDIHALLDEATADEIALARSLLATMEERGADRGRALVAHLDRVLAERGTRRETDDG